MEADYQLLMVGYACALTHCCCALCLSVYVCALKLFMRLNGGVTTEPVMYTTVQTVATEITQYMQ